jgi:signal transduction histidine kinase
VWSSLSWSLERKFVVLAAAVVGVGSLVGGAGLLRTLGTLSYEDSERSAIRIAETTAAAFSNTLLYREIGLVREYGLLESQILSLVRNPRTAIEQVVVIDPAGRVLESNDLTAYGAKEHAVRDAARLNASSTHVILVDRNAFVVVTPLAISSRHFGQLAIRFSRREQNQRLKLYAARAVLVTVLVFLCAIFVAVVAGRALARPIKRLASEMRHIEAPDYETIIVSERSDEIGELERSFLGMLDRLRNYEESVERQRRDLAQTERLATVGTLVAGLAHEVNNPLSGARTCLKRIRRDPANETQTRRYAEMMDEALERLERVVRNLLDFARPREQVLGRVVLDVCMAQAVNFAEVRADLKAVSLVLDLGSGRAQVDGDEDSMVQLFTNLLINAIDATPQGSRVELVSGVDGVRIWAEVRDEGPGVAESDCDRIFEPFFTTKAVGKGTGLGLWVCKGIVESHRGRIRVRNGDSGAIFRVDFPIHRTDPLQEGR